MFCNGFVLYGAKLYKEKILTSSSLAIKELIIGNY